MSVPMKSHLSPAWTISIASARNITSRLRGRREGGEIGEGRGGREEGGEGREGRERGGRGGREEGGEGERREGEEKRRMEEGYVQENKRREERVWVGGMGKKWGRKKREKKFEEEKRREERKREKESRESVRLYLKFSASVGTFLGCSLVAAPVVSPGYEPSGNQQTVIRVGGRRGGEGGGGRGDKWDEM